MTGLRAHGFWEDERGFTLPEVLMTIVVMGIVLAIASSTWFRVIESRTVDSAANQMVSELRLAHSKATNRLTTWRVEIDSGTRNYRIGPSGGALSSRSLPEGTKFATAVSVIDFKSNGEAQPTGSGNITVAADDDYPSYAIQINTATSRIKVVS